MEYRNRKWFVRLSKTNQTTNGLFEYNFNDLYEELKGRYDTVIYIIHDVDVNNIHAHFIIQNANAIRFSSLKKLMPYGSIEKQKGSNKECYEYLLHKNNADKIQYSENNVISSVDINSFITEVIDVDLDVGVNLMSTIEESQTLFEVFKKNPSVWNRANCVVAIWNAYQEHKAYREFIHKKQLLKESMKNDLISAFGDLENIEFEE